MPDFLKMSDEELVRSYNSTGRRKHRRLFLEILLDRYFARIASLCLQLLGNLEDAADCAQESLLIIAENLPCFRYESRFKTWSYAIVRNTCLSELKRRRRFPDNHTGLADSQFVQTDAQSIPPERVSEKQELHLLFWNLVANKLTREELEVVRLHHIEGRSLGEVDRIRRLGNQSGSKAFLLSAKRKLRHPSFRAQLCELGFLLPQPEGSTLISRFAAEAEE